LLTCYPESNFRGFANGNSDNFAAGANGSRQS
jgi:hypothetical protein